MSAHVFSGRAIAQELRQEVARGVRALQQSHRVSPGLAVVRVEGDPSAAASVEVKRRACQHVGILLQEFSLPADATQQELCSLVERLNCDHRSHGILVQYPLPQQMDLNLANAAIAPEKDIDGQHPISLGLLSQGRPRFIPAIPAAIQVMLLRRGIPVEGRRVVVCGDSNLVGRATALLLAQKAPGANATVTLCQADAPGLRDITLQADILIAAVGRPVAITADMVRPGAVVIDAGSNVVADASRPRGYRLVGDVDFQAVSRKAAAITPVPGGVGPVTAAILLRNTLQAAQESAGGA